MPRLRQIALRPQDRLLHVRALHKPRTHFIEACCPAHSSPVAPFGFVGPGLPPPPCRLSRHPLHFHGRVLKVSGIVRGEYDVIRGVVEQLMAQNSKPLLRLRRTALRLQDRLQRVRALRKPRTHFIDACCPAHRSPMAPFSFVGPCTSSPPRRLPRCPRHFHGRIHNVSGIA